jgi:hypothetical protein
MSEEAMSPILAFPRKLSACFGTVKEAVGLFWHLQGSCAPVGIFKEAVCGENRWARVKRTKENPCATSMDAARPRKKKTIGKIEREEKKKWALASS